MSEPKRKYTILPGVPTPDFESILEASSDYSDPGELEFTMRSYTEMPKPGRTVTSPSATDIANLQKLGDEVSEEEERAKEISRERMEAIKARSVTMPASIEELRDVARNSDIDDDKRDEIETDLKSRQDEAEKKEELEKIRAERRSQQKKAVEEIRARSAANEAAAQKAAEEAKEDEENLILSDDDAADSFSEFL